jgi:hypothetical protein
MKSLLIAVALTAATTPILAADIGLSLSIDQPGSYGRLDIGDALRPRLIYQRPIVIERGVVGHRPPIYLHVPVSHARHWRQHCHEYGACGERVFFVDDDWYHREYVPHYQQRHRDRRDGYRDGHRDDHRGNQNDHHGGGHAQHGQEYVQHPQEHHRDRRDERKDEHRGNQDNRHGSGSGSGSGHNHNRNP